FQASFPLSKEILFIDLCSSSCQLTLLSVRDRDIVEIDGARGTIEEHEPGIGSSHGEISIDRTDRGSIEPGLCMPRSCLIVLHLDAIPGIGAQGIIGTEDGIDGATGIPEVDIQSMSTGIVVHLPDVVAVAVAGNRQLSASGHITVETEVETSVGLCLWTGGQGSVDIGVLATGVVESQGIRTAVDHRALHAHSAGTIAAGQGPGVKIATLKPITEVGRRDYPR